MTDVPRGHDNVSRCRFVDGGLFDRSGCPVGYCTKTDDNKNGRVFGYAIVSAFGVPEVGTVPRSMPILTWRLSLSPGERRCRRIGPGTD
jgi:hypothetical protein